MYVMICLAVSLPLLGVIMIPFIYRVLLLSSALLLFACDLGDIGEPIHNVSETSTVQPDWIYLDSTNLIENGGFEDRYDGWNLYAYDGAAAEMDISPYAYKGSHSMHVSVTEPGQNTWSILLTQDPIEVEVDQRYQLSLWMRAIDQEMSAIIKVQMSAEPWRDHVSEWWTLTQTWQNLTIDFTGGWFGDQEDKFLINFIDTGDYWIDEVSVYQYRQDGR